MRVFRDFHDYYLRNDVVLLANIVTEFRKLIWTKFKTDICHFQGTPSLTYYLARFLPKMELATIPDRDLYLLFTKNIRGGVTQVMHRYFNMDDYPTGYAFYLDVNSLYPSCMIQELPGKYLGASNLPSRNPDHMNFVLCDMEYPDELHDRDRGMPYCPEHWNGRLCTTFLKKTEILLLEANWEFYKQRGLVCSKIHNWFVFEKTYALREYIEMTVKERREALAAGNAPLANIAKLLGNSLYGKTCENVFRYKKLEVRSPVVTPDGRVNNFLANAKNFLPIGGKFLCHFPNTQVDLSKPIQVGFTVLEHAKRAVYQMITNLQQTFGDALQLVYTDTDSLLFLVKHWDNPKHPLQVLEEQSHLLDFSKETANYPAITDPKNKKKMGLWADETDDKQIAEFVGLRAKTYAVRMTDGSEKLRNKGVMKSAKHLENDRGIDYSDYRSVLFERNVVKVRQQMIRSKKHNVGMHIQEKIALNGDDQKRFVLSDGIHTVPFGYRGNLYKDEYYYNP